MGAVMKRTAVALILIVAFFSAAVCTQMIGLAATVANAIEVTATITLENPGGYYGIAYDSGKGEIFVTYSESNRVSVISDSSGTSPSPTATPSDQQPEPFPTTLVATASGISVAVVGLGFFVYLKKRKQ
jgi:hypothetical protein